MKHIMNVLIVLVALTLSGCTQPLPIAPVDNTIGHLQPGTLLYIANRCLEGALGSTTWVHGKSYFFSMPLQDGIGYAFGHFNGEQIKIVSGGLVNFERWRQFTNMLQPSGWEPLIIRSVMTLRPPVFSPVIVPAFTLTIAADPCQVILCPGTVYASDAP